jgi:hypothetical protein
MPGELQGRSIDEGERPSSPRRSNSRRFSVVECGDYPSRKSQLVIIMNKLWRAVDN